MKKENPGKYKIFFVIVIVIGLAYSMFGQFTAREVVQKRSSGHAAVSWKLPVDKVDSGYLIRMVLPERIESGEVLAYYSTHRELTATIDGREVYSLHASGTGRIDTTGYVWNFIELVKEDAGKTIEIRIDNNGRSGMPGNKIYYGNQMLVVKKIIWDCMLRALLGACILVLGIIFLLLQLLMFRDKSIGTGVSFLFFSLFAVFLGTWSVCESGLLELLLPWHIGLSLATHVIFMMMPLVFGLYLCELFHAGNLLLRRLFELLSATVVVLRIFLQIVGLLGFHETLWMTHITIGVLAVLGVYLMLREYRCKQHTRELEVNLFCLSILLVTTALEVIVYRVSYHTVAFGSVGFLIYILIGAGENIRKTNKMLLHARETEMLRKLAFKDGLTTLNNRAAFNRDMAELGDEPAALFMMDLDNLKKCNDTYGHKNGDRYILYAADAISRVFSGDGKCYRIGGDEFCAIIPGLVSCEKAERLMTELNGYLRNEEEIDLPFQAHISVGYALYEPKEKCSPDEIMRRADEMMYREKEKQKKAFTT